MVDGVDGWDMVGTVQSIAGMSTLKHKFRFQSAKAERLSALVEFPAMAGIVPSVA